MPRTPSDSLSSVSRDQLVPSQETKNSAIRWPEQLEYTIVRANLLLVARCIFNLREETLALICAWHESGIYLPSFRSLPERRTMLRWPRDVADGLLGTYAYLRAGR